MSTIDELGRPLRLPEVRQETGLGRSTIYRRMKEGSFPQQVDLGGGVVAWWESDIKAWKANRPKKGVSMGVSGASGQ